MDQPRDGQPGDQARSPYEIEASGPRPMTAAHRGRADAEASPGGASAERADGDPSAESQGEQPFDFQPNDFVGRVGPSHRRGWVGILPPEAGAANMNPGRAVATLLFRPSSFFRRYGSIEACTGVFWLVLWFVSVMLVVDKIETKTLTGRSTILPPNWILYWMFVLFAGAVGTLGIMLVRGWWYRLRLYMCGVGKHPAYWRGLRIWTGASLITVVPLFAIAMISTLYFDTPEEMMWRDLPGELYWMWVLPLLPFWSMVASYKGVRAVFPEAKKWAARAWFLIAPSVVFVLALLLLGVGMWMQGFPTPPDTDRPLAFESRAFSLEYPGNWILAETNEEHDPDRLLFFETPHGGTVSLMLMARPWSAPAHIADRREMLTDYGLILDDPESFGWMAGRTGAGERSEYTDLLVPWVHELFVTDLSDHASLEVEVLRPKAAAEHTDEGVGFIVESLRVTTPDKGPVHMGDPVYASGDRWAVNYPRDWFLMSETPTTLSVEGWRPVTWSAMVYRSQKTIEDEIAATLAGDFDEEAGIERTTFDTWAGLRGTGVAVRGTPAVPSWLDADGDGSASDGLLSGGIDGGIDGGLGSSRNAPDPIETRVFIHELPSGELLEIVSSARVGDLPEVGPALEMIERSFVLKPIVAPDTDG